MGLMPCLCILVCPAWADAHLVHVVTERDFIRDCGGPNKWNLYRNYASSWLCHPLAKEVTFLTVESYTGEQSRQTDWLCHPLAKEVTFLTVKSYTGEQSRQTDWSATRPPRRSLS
jgi:hypothetical protein